MKKSPADPAPATGAPSPDPAALCPACERFIGPATRCPYCDSDANTPPVLRAMRIGALVLAGAGLALLFVMARYSRADIVRVGDITPMMNYAFVSVSGEVERKPYIGYRTGVVDYVAFTITDESGALRVVANGPVARALSEGGRLPAARDRVTVSGTLQVGGENQQPRLRLAVAAHLKPQPRAAAPAAATPAEPAAAREP